MSHYLMIQFNQRPGITEQYLTFMVQEYADMPFAEYISINKDETVQRYIINWLKNALYRDEDVFLMLSERHTAYSNH